MIPIILPHLFYPEKEEIPRTALHKIINGVQQGLGNFGKVL